jgi:chemotaxis protein CheC
VKLSSEQLDALTEIINIGVGDAAASLSELVAERVELRVPFVTVCSSAAAVQILRDRHSERLDTSIVQEFQGSVSGRALLAFPRSSTLKLGQILASLDKEPQVIDLELGGMLSEVGNIVLNGVMGTISNLIDDRLEYSLSRLVVDTAVTDLMVDDSLVGPRDPAVLIADAQFNIMSRNVSGSLLVVFHVGSIERILASMTSISGKA